MVANATTLAQRTLQALLESRFGYLGCQHGTFAVFLMECSLALTTVKYLGLRLRLYACAISCFEALQSSEGHTCALQLSQRLLQQVLLLEKYESQVSKRWRRVFLPSLADDFRTCQCPRKLCLC